MKAISNYPTVIGFVVIFSIVGIIEGAGLISTALHMPWAEVSDTHQYFFAFFSGICSLMMLIVMIVVMFGLFCLAHSVGGDIAKDMKKNAEK